MNILDRLIAWAAPARGLRRARARLQINAVRKYESASTGRRLDGWLTRSTSANTEIGESLVYTRNRHRALVRDNPWASRAVQAIVSNTVGYGFSAKVRGPKKAADMFAAWWGSRECDADGRHNGAGLEALCMRTVVECGEALIIRVASPGSAIPIKIRIREGDLLDHSLTHTLTDGGYIIQGVQFSASGAVVGYWLFDTHPGDVLATGMMSKFTRASDVAHVFRTDRPGQVRGMPWGAATIITLRDLDDYEDAYLLRQKLANCQVGVIFDSEASVINSEAVAAGAPLGEAMEPGRYEFLPPGKDIRFNAPPNAGDYGPFVRDCLLRVAAGYGITFQALTGDLSSVNFSSGRMGWIEMGRNIDAWRWQMLVPQGLDVIARWFADMVQVSVGIRADNISIRWDPPRREMINPKDDADSMNVLVRNGFMSWPQALRELGEDPDATLDEIDAWQKKLDKLGIKLDCDPRADSGGMTQQQGTANDNTPAT